VPKERTGKGGEKDAMKKSDSGVKNGGVKKCRTFSGRGRKGARERKFCSQALHIARLKGGGGYKERIGNAQV